MPKTIEVVFDGKTFVPTGPVDLPAGTTATVALPEAAPPCISAGPPPTAGTPDERAEWTRLCGIWATSPLPWATVDKALAYSRGRPRPDPSGDAP